MICMLCADNRMGLWFNHRRQSQDRALRARVCALAGARRLWMNAYTYAQFADQPNTFIVVDDDFLQKAQPGDFCFVEGMDLSPYASRLESIILYRWNRTYPADMFFTFPPCKHGWRLIRTTDFAGFSHPCITEEVYVR